MMKHRAVGNDPKQYEFHSRDKCDSTNYMSVDDPIRGKDLDFVILFDRFEGAMNESVHRGM